MIKSFKLFLLLSCLYGLKFTNAQTNPTSITLNSPTNCSSAQYYDISRLICMPCPANSTTSSLDVYNCKCVQSYYFTVNNGGGSVVCTPCGTYNGNQLIQTLDGYDCIYCDQTCQNCNQNGGYRTDLDVNGKPTYISGSVPLTRTSICVTCDSTNSIFTGSSCNSCKPLIFIDAISPSINSLSCQNPTFISNDGLLIYPTSITTGTTSTDPNYFNVNFGSDSTVISNYFSNNLLGAYRTCKYSTYRNTSACEALGNMCVLNLYASSTSAVNIDACKAFNLIQNSGQTGQSLLYGQSMPWLFYLTNSGSNNNYYIQSGTNDPNNPYIILQFNNKCSSSYLAFYAAQYRLNGSLIKYDTIDVSKFQLCNYLSTSFSEASQVSPFSATNYQQSCSVSAGTLLEIGKNPIFYDVFLKYSTSTNLYPIPVAVQASGQSSSGLTASSSSDPNSYSIYRRFFLAEAISSNQKYVRYAQSVSIIFTLVPNDNSGKIYPPLFLVNYNYFTVSNSSAQIPVSFSIQYQMDISQQILAVLITSGVLCLFVFIWSIIRTWVWMRRSGRLALDLINLFKLAMYIISGVGDVVWAVSIGWAIYWLIFYKGQGVAFVVIPLQGQETVLLAFIVISFVLKLIDVLHLIFTQTSYDVFFIDWERPKVEDSGVVGSNIIKSTSKLATNTNSSEDRENLIKNELKEFGKVSCWRTLFVCNEWNEIQTFRKISPTIQLMGILLLLKVVNLEAFTTSDCNTSIVRDPNAYQAPYSGFLRVGMAASMFLGVGLAQYFFYVFLYIRCIEDKLNQFVDFCSVSNISMFIMSHTQYGYYIHGRSPHGNTDVSMQKMSEALLKEQNDVTAKRGLEQGSDHQTFSISISDKLSKQYIRVMHPLKEKSYKSFSGAFTSTDFEKRMLAYSQLNRFLMAFIDNILRDMRYVVTKRNLVENVLDFEFKEPIQTGFFYADEDNPFQEVIFSGNERKLFTFDLALFLFVDYFAQNYVLAAFITYVVQKVYNILRNDLGARNLSKKTLVDKRFLI